MEDKQLFVIDTHTLFWHLVAPERLSAKARDVFALAYDGRATLVLSPIVLLELYGVIRKVNAQIDYDEELDNFVRPPFRVEPITIEDLKLLSALEDVPELHDRLICATALRLNAPVVTRDPEIRRSALITSVW